MLPPRDVPLKRTPGTYNALLVAAFAPELAPFPLSDDGTVRAGHVVARPLAVGIGMVAAAEALARELARSLPDEVVFAGTCGAYEGRGLVCGDVIVSTRVVLGESAVARGLSAFPEPMTAALLCAPDRIAAFARAGARPAAIATTLSVTVDDACAGALRDASGAAVEHLEAYAVGLACERAGVPWSVVLGVANRVGASGRGEWRANHHDASRAAARVVLATWAAQGS